MNSVLRLADVAAVAPAPETPAGNDSARPRTALACQRCGFPVPGRAWGCKNPCANCGIVYPLGDCSD